MEAESKLHSEMWGDLTLRSFGMSNGEEENVWIVDAAADQCTVTKKAWYVESSTGTHVQCNSYLENDFPSTKCKLHLPSLLNLY